MLIQNLYHPLDILLYPSRILHLGHILHHQVIFLTRASVVQDDLIVTM